MRRLFGRPHRLDQTRPVGVYGTRDQYGAGALHLRAKKTRQKAPEGVGCEPNEKSQITLGQRPGYETSFLKARPTKVARGGSPRLR